MDRSKGQTVWQQIGLLALAGALGALSRYGLSTMVHGLCGEKFPWGTLAVNAIGCLLFGLILTLANERALISIEARIVLLTGFMGAFTTFSTFAFETQQLLTESRWMLAGANLLGQNVIGIVAVLAGICLGKAI